MSTPRTVTGICAQATSRAVTHGTYVLPPLSAECMYDIAVNGIAGAGTVTVLPAK
ncbi:MAG: hypothetical protein H0W78_02315 [Planctomycetes bacterium]|nr:hypothetical protein [Planctomycetota bacterium]